MTRVKGFTLVELMVTIAVAAILLAIAMPSLDNISASNALKSTTRDLVSTISTARSQSISTRTDIEVRPTGGGWADGWSIVYGDGAAEEDQNYAPRDGVTVTRSGSNGALEFLARGGMSGGAATFTVCHADLSQGRSVSVSFLGKVTTAVGTC
ncbi:type IV fimbrial biogenesis protein FimT [Halopseudomonas litoralis]|uniref:Type II secretion system protein H n=1 Tax=Halopseudomonas litoralis TaxID=797277 RepID=A0A1H1TYV7_9GAMM|nr:GspH/FimT family protein [Halopseudomonas litoralis]SDS65341.1 type IV fimbrial biogenesis protein FimT [Halopseudomonas litoralis]